ncbi:MAG: prolyl oligopeptidase family serine peptidase [Bacteroidetes bacterium]|nr:prolyl oligopeptidase family serine peptidase [Bacteroidota bacterium]
MKHLKLSLTIGLFFLISISSFAQKKELTLDVVNSRTSYLLYPEYARQYKEMRQLQWVTGEDAYTYVKTITVKDKSLDAIYKGSIKAKGADKMLLNIDGFNKFFYKAGFDSLRAIPNFSWHSPTEMKFQKDGQILILDIKKGGVTIANCCNANAANADVEPNSFNIAFTVDNNLFVSFNKKEAFQITKDDDKGIVNGQTVHRNEFGIHKGTFWSPKGNYLAFYRKDETKVGDYPVMDISKTPATVEMVKYPMAGTTSEEVTLGVFDVNKKKTIFIKTGEPKEQFLTNIAWSPDEQFIFIAVLNRAQNHMKLNQYNAKSGEFVKTLFEEKNLKYVEPQDPMIFLEKNPNEFLWFSRRNGFNQLYHYSIDGELIEQITDSKADVLSFLGFSVDGKQIRYIAIDEEFPLQKHAYSTNLETQEIVRLTTADGTHRLETSSSKNFMIDIYSSQVIPNEVALIDANGMIIKKIYVGENPLKEYKTGETKVGSIKAEDGTDLYYRLIKPTDFDASKKYPVIVYVYGGPHAQMVNNSWLNSASLWMHYMANQGFVIFTVDNRGSGNRGQKFEQVIFRNMGKHEIDDQMKGIEFLRGLNYVDMDRIGVHGWSYGGFMTASLMCRQPETFKVGVSGAPVIDWKYYEIMYGERYMDTPEENPKGYEKANVLTYIDDLKGKLLLVHGTSDVTVVWQHTLKFIEQANHKGVQVDYYVYPGHKHAVRGIDRGHLDKKMAQYFIDNL